MFSSSDVPEESESDAEEEDDEEDEEDDDDVDDPEDCVEDLEGFTDFWASFLPSILGLLGPFAWFSETKPDQSKFLYL